MLNFFDYLNQKIDTNLGGFLGTICAKKDVLSEIGYFGNDSKSLEGDVITWKKIVLATDCILIDKPILCYYRQHTGQVSMTAELKTTIVEYFDFFNEYKNTLYPLDIDGRKTKQFLDYRISSYIIHGISIAFKQKKFSFLFENLKFVRKYRYKIPIILILKRYSIKFLNKFLSIKDEENVAKQGLTLDLYDLLVKSLKNIKY